MPRSLEEDKEAALAELRLGLQPDAQPPLSEPELDQLLEKTQRADFWAAATAYLVGDIILPVTLNGHRFRCICAGTSGATEPAWPKSWGATISDGDELLWQEDGPEFKNVFDARSAIHYGWMLKASKVAHLHDTKTSGSSFSQSQVYDHCLQMADRFAPIGIA
jgi:hypothetical protein